MKRTLTALTAGAILLLTLTACGKASSEADFRSALDTERGVTLTLGMTQDAVEELLGETLAQDPTLADYYLVPSTGEGSVATSLLIQDRIVLGIRSQSPAIKLQGDFGVGSLISQLGDGWSLTRASDTIDFATRYFDQEGNLLFEATEDAVVMHTLAFYDGSEAAAEASLYTLN